MIFSKVIRFFIGATVILVFSGCAITQYKHGDAAFWRVSFLADTKIPNAQAVVLPEGTRVFILQGFDQNQSRGGAAAIEGITEAVIHSIKPIP